MSATLVRYLAWAGVLLGAASTWGQSAPAAPSTAPAATTEAQRPAQRTPQEVLALRVAEISLEAAPLKAALDWVAELTGVTIHVNWEQLDQVGVLPGTPVTLQARDLRLRDVMSLLLRDAGGLDVRLGFLVRENLIYVTTTAELDRELVTRIYFVADLLTPSQRPSRLFAGRITDYVTSVQPRVAAGVAMAEPIIERYGSGTIVDFNRTGRDENESIERETQRLLDELVRAITGGVEPGSWEGQGGQGTIQTYRGMLIVRNSPRVHQELENALAEP